MIYTFFSGDSAQLAFAKVSHLPAVLLEEMKALEKEKNELKRDVHKRQFLFTRYQEVFFFLEFDFSLSWPLFIRRTTVYG